METDEQEITYLKEYIEYLDGQIRQRDSLIQKLTSILQQNTALKPDACFCECYTDGKNDFVQMSISDYRKILGAYEELRERCAQLTSEIELMLLIDFEKEKS